jgi:glycosyltransferase involved in cell wall biosynthesis
LGRTTILHTINSLGIGGAEVLLRDTIAGLKEFDHIICYLNSPDTLANSFDSHQVYKLDHKSWSNSLVTIKRIKKIIRDHKVQIVHAHLFEATLVSRLAAGKQVHFFFTIHNMLSKDAFEVNPLSKYAEKLTYKKEQHIISVSKEALKDYDKWIGIKGNSTVLYNYVHQRYFDIQFDYAQMIQNQFRLIAVGNLRRQKNYPTLLKAFTLLKDLPVSLDIYGSGDMKEELQNIISSENINARLMGRADDMAKVLPAYHAYIMASIFEGFGIAPMEAMATGMPVLLSQLEVFKELGEDVPEYFNPEDPQSIASAVRNAYLNWSTIKEKAFRGKEIVYQKASEEVYFNKLSAIYRSEQN